MGLFKKLGFPDIINLIKRGENLVRSGELEKAYEVIRTVEDNNDILRNTQLKFRLYRLREDYGAAVISHQIYHLGAR